VTGNEEQMKTMTARITKAARASLWPLRIKSILVPLHFLPSSKKARLSCGLRAAVQGEADIAARRRVPVNQPSVNTKDRNESETNEQTR
jgi:hypothetical protein